MEKPFRTIEISNPEFEKDGLRFITVKSVHLKSRGDICVYIPPGLSMDAPVAILLHGVYGSAWSWAWSGGAHPTAAEMIATGKIPPMVLAMPSDGLWGDGSAYLPHNGFDFERWIAIDVPAALRYCIPEISSNSPFYISGLSMGGFGALKIASKYHHLFKAVSTHSSITSLEQMKHFAEEETALYQQEDKVEEDCYQTMLKRRHHLPAIRFDCGREDLLIEYNRRLHLQLEQGGIDHLYEEFSGGHEWHYWQEHLKDSLLFFAACHARNNDDRPR